MNILGKEISEKRLDKIVGNYVKKLAGQQESKRKFFESKPFNTIINNILKGKEVEEDLINKVFGSIEIMFPNSEVKVESDYFPQYYIEYKGIRFNIIYGQGTVIIPEVL